MRACVRVLCVRACVCVFGSCEKCVRAFVRACVRVLCVCVRMRVHVKCMRVVCGEKISSPTVLPILWNLGTLAYLWSGGNFR